MNVRNIVMNKEDQKRKYNIVGPMKAVNMFIGLND